MKHPGLAALLVCFFALPAAADLTLVQEIEGAGPVSQITMKIKGDKVRIDAAPEMTTIVDSKTGEMLNLMNSQKTVMRMSGDQVKAAAAMAGKTLMGEGQATAGQPKITPTGKKETINGYEAEEYVCDTPSFHASYWVARNYPQSEAIMKQLQSTTPQTWSAAGGTGMPDFRDFPGLPIRTNISMGEQKYVTTITSVKLDPLDAAEFAVPQGFQEMKMPDLNALLGGSSPPPKAGAAPKK